MSPTPLVNVVPSIARVPHRAVISVCGSQASSFLNGLLTSTVHVPSKPFYSAFLNAQGRVLYDTFLYTTSDTSGNPSYLLDYDSRPSQANPLLSLLKRSVLRSKVKVRDVSDEYEVWASWGNVSRKSLRGWTRNSGGVVYPNWDSGEWPWGTQHRSILDRRAVGMGKRMLVRRGDLPHESSRCELKSSEDYTLHRITHGVPEGQVDMPALQAFPMESNLDVMGALEFRKGCYVGQELTARTFHTGTIRKRIFPVVIHRPNEKSPGSVIRPKIAISYPTNVDICPVTTPDLDQSSTKLRPRGFGKLLSSYNGVGLALLRLEHIAAMRAGRLELHFNAKMDGDEDIWAVSPWWPDWWQQQPTS